jgi:hypothetical protein
MIPQTKAGFLREHFWPREPVVPVSWYGVAAPFGAEVMAYISEGMCPRCTVSLVPVCVAVPPYKRVPGYVSAPGASWGWCSWCATGWRLWEDEDWPSHGFTAWWLDGRLSTVPGTSPGGPCGQICIVGDLS